MTEQPTPQRVMIIDDMLPNALLAAVVVERLDNVSVLIREDATQALEDCCANPPDLILLDYVMPDLDGITFVRRLRERLKDVFVPVIMVTGESRAGTLADAMTAGATDFLRKPWDEAELEARARNMLALRQSYLDLRAKNEELRILATTDALTGVLNRRAFVDGVDIELERAARYGRHVALLMMDIDLFKRVNDTHGHGVGDTVLKAFAVHCRLHLRDVDLLGRLGGEEFAALLPETDGAGAQVVADRLRAQLAATAIPSEAGPIPVSVSIGVATAQPGEDFDALMRRADAALYASKEHGRNRVTMA